MTLHNFPQSCQMVQEFTGSSVAGGFQFWILHVMWNIYICWCTFNNVYLLLKGSSHRHLYGWGDVLPCWSLPLLTLSTLPISSQQKHGEENWKMGKGGRFNLVLLCSAFEAPFVTAKVHCALPFHTALCCCLFLAWILEMQIAFYLEQVRVPLDFPASFQWRQRVFPMW